MANPFGAVVDNFKLDENSSYAGRDKTQEDRAREAMKLDTDNGKYTQAESYAKDLKTAWGNGTVTHCLLYNATGDNLRLVDYRERDGFIGRTPFPLVIGNGQWASFLHVENYSSGSVGAVVYRGKNASGDLRDFYFSWRTKKNLNNSVLCDVGPVDSFATRWTGLFTTLNTSSAKHTVNRDGVNMEVDIAISQSDPFYRAIVTIPFRLDPPSSLF